MKKTVSKKKKFPMIYVYIGIVVVLFGSIFAVSNMSPVNALYDKKVNDLNPATRAQLNDPNYQNIILPADLDKKIADKEDFFVYMFSSSCHYCQVTTPQLVPLVQELGIDMPQFNLLEFPAYNNKMNINYTPTLLYYKDGVEVDRMESGIREEGTDVGYTIDDFRAFFTKYSGAEAQ
jgi:thiol-disulfide isomerase/thioredoxin